MMKKLIIYGGSFCPRCDMLKKFCVANSIGFEFINIVENDDLRRELSEKGFTHIPVIKIGDDISEFDGNFVVLKQRLSA